MSVNLLESIESYKQLEDARIHDFIYKHNKLLKEVNMFDLDSASPFQLAKMEYLYSQAQLYAYLICSHYRKVQRYHEAHAEQDFANQYESIRDDKEAKRSAADAQVIARLSKGKQMEKAGEQEGNYMRWNGIAHSYENMIYSLKDMIKTVQKEGG